SNTLMLASHARSCFVRKGPPYPSHTTHRNWRFPGSPSTSRLRPHGQVQSSALMIGNIILLPKIWWLLRFLQVIQQKPAADVRCRTSHPKFSQPGEYGVSLSQSLVFVAPISPRSSTSPGAVGRPGARRNIIHIASMYV